MYFVHSIHATKKGNKPKIHVMDNNSQRMKKMKCYFSLHKYNSHETRGKPILWLQ